jgi:hypothetical protein
MPDKKPCWATVLARNAAVAIARDVLPPVVAAPIAARR